ncbi:MAG: Na+/H+ antiporter NhaC family protein [Mariniblastus sp.]|nr:Na+/H+ antiporter NhaC family protein [Mariniblastus sp.]
MSHEDQSPATPFYQAILPVFVLVLLVGYGLIIRPLAFDQTAMPLELIFILAAAFMVSQLLLTGHKWANIQDSIVAKFQKAIPAFMILFCIGLVIASWIVCGTVPMLVYWGLRIVEPQYLYLLAFLAPIVFSMLTGTSWGSVGTIGVVLIGIATALDANLGITAGAIIGGAYFGDKLSPLSDTTNLAALAAEVDLHDHIRSMLWSTVPSALMAGGIYFWMGAVYPPTVKGGELQSLAPILNGLSSIFNFSWFLLLPAVIVLAGSLWRMPSVPVLISSVLVASLLAVVCQGFTVTDVMASLHQGFDTEMVTWAGEIPEPISVLLNRGGLYALSEPIIIAFMVFIFIGAMDHIAALPTVVKRMTTSLRSPASTVIAALGATALTNALTSNQFATSFIIGDAFKSKFDDQLVPRPVLSRSLEDTGTMLESIVPWHTSAVYMVATLGVPLAEYWHWQLLSLCNFGVAILLAITGIGCFYGTTSKTSGH